MKNKIFTELYIKYHRLVIKSVLDQTGDYQLAEEICQQVFMKFYDNMDTVSPDFVKTWLLLTSKRMVIDNSRTARVKNEIVVSSTQVNTVLDYTVDDYINKSANEHLIFTIMEDLKRVNEKWFQAINMIEIEGKSQQETAEELGITVFVLRARIYRAKQYIRGKYWDEYKEGN